MSEYDAAQVQNCYDLAAGEYATKFLNELDYKPFDRNVLDRFSEQIPPNGIIYDFGCGSGQTTKYLHDKRKHKIIGLDFSAQTVALAQQHFPEIEFRLDDMLASQMGTSSADGIVAFYAIVHFTYAQVEQTLREWHRLLKANAPCLFSFHVGDESITVTDFLGVNGAQATWRFLETDKVLALAQPIGFKQVETVIRYPYVGVEHESKRAYVWLAK